MDPHQPNNAFASLPQNQQVIFLTTGNQPQYQQIPQHQFQQLFQQQQQYPQYQQYQQTIYQHQQQYQQPIIFAPPQTNSFFDPQFQLLQSNNSTSTTPNIIQPKQNNEHNASQIPARDSFCLNWQSCPETKDHSHRCSYRHLCTVKNCSKTEDKVHIGRFLHSCKYGEKCRKIEDINHNHNFIHPCKYQDKCKKIGDITHRIFFSHKPPTNESTHSMSWKDGSAGHFARVNLPPTSAEYKKVEKKFLERVNHSYKTAKVEGIERIENSKLWKNFTVKKSEVIFKNQSTKAEDQVKTLYHGADETAVDAIVKDGFDFRKCQVGHYGSGNYFAVNASYSHGYASPSSDGKRRMIVCTVVVGEALRVSQKDQSLKRPQDKVTGKMYDSVQAGPTGTEYVLFDNESPYPEYVVIYK